MYGLTCLQIEEYSPAIPGYFPELVIPEKNPLSKKKIRLGERLFNDPTLSIDSTIMCASCHKRELAFADSLAISPGVFGKLGDRNSPSLINAAFSPLINRDGGVTKLDIQALIPIEDHNEMGISIIELSQRLEQDHEYSKLFQDAFNQTPNGFTIPRAFSSYVRSLIDGSSPYDEFLQGNVTAMSDSAIRGMNLFNSDSLACSNCHSGPLLSKFNFEHNGLYKNYKDFGRALITLKKEDQGKFRIPSLRNISLTAPYMHDGSLSTIDEVIDHYISGGTDHQNKSNFINGFALNKNQKSDLKEFLKTLTSRDLDAFNYNAE